MPIVNRKSAQITNNDSVPPIMNNPAVEHQFLRAQHGAITAVAADSIGSVYQLLRVPSNARVESLRAFNTADATAAADIGLYPAGSTLVAQAIDADFFASAVAFSAASTVGVDVTHESGVWTALNGGQMLWQALGLTKDPNVMYDICATLTGATTGALQLALKGDYVI